MHGPGERHAAKGKETTRSASLSTAGGATAGVTTTDTATVIGAIDTNTTAGAAPSSAGDNTNSSDNGAEIDNSEDYTEEPQGTLSFFDAKFAVYASELCVSSFYSTATALLCSVS
jgi:hypothetical protein